MIYVENICALRGFYPRGDDSPELSAYSPKILMRNGEELTDLWLDKVSE